MLAGEPFQLLVDAARCGAEWAWSRRVEDIDGTLRGYVRRQGGIDPDDLVGETWLRCGIRGRRMQGQQNHYRPYYRCRFPDEYGTGEAQHPRNVYVKESVVMPGLDQWLASFFDQEHLEETCQVLAGASQPDPKTDAHQAALSEQIRDCDRRLGQYQAVLDEGPTPRSSPDGWPKFNGSETTWKHNSAADPGARG